MNSESQDINKTQGKEYMVPCVKCSGKTVHKVLASADISGEDGDENFSVSWWKNYQIIQCLGCKSISFRTESGNSEDLYPVDNDGNYEWDSVENLYPPRLEWLKGLGDVSYYFPSKVGRIYEETLKALSNQSPVLAGIGLRALLETVCEEKNAAGGNLFQKIDSLVEKKVLTPAGARILHKIRALGNAAAHEVKPHTDKQLGLALDIVEHLLRDVYILPKQVESEFADDDEESLS